MEVERKMEAFANELVKEVNVVMGAIIKQADKDAVNLMQDIAKSTVGDWTVTDVTPYSSSFYSIKDDPTTRTISMNLDITSVCENALAAIKKEYPLIVEGHPFRKNYHDALMKHLETKNPHQKTSSWVFSIRFYSGNGSMEGVTMDKTVLVISYSYKV
jgi:hypothetical protein